MPVVDKPDWVSHEGNSIFSCDIHPDGSRLVTAGEDSKVRVWNMGPILNNSHERTPDVPRKLATLTEHGEHSVNIVRFSPDGQLLASGGDDRAVCIYRKSTGQGKSAFGSNEGPNIDNWKAVRICRRHTLSVNGVAWSPDSSLIASCSLDGDAIIWNAMTGESIAVLSAHTSFVKGVAWDPVNSYVATISEDRSAILWSTSTWAPQTTISSCLENMPSTTLFCRLTWSMLGDQLALVNSSNTNICTLTMCPREAWEGEQKHYVGHSGAVVTARYSQALFYSDKTQSIAVQYVAAGSQDRSFSVWAQGSPKPLLVLKKGFKGTVSDLAWSPDGHHLIAVSTDGTVLCVSFTTAELGEPIPRAKVDELVMQMYGDARAAMDCLLENADMLDIVGDHESSHSRPPSNGGLPPIASPGPQHPPAPAVRVKSKKLSARLGPAGAATPGAPSRPVLPLPLPVATRPVPVPMATGPQHKRPRMAEPADAPETNHRGHAAGSMFDSIPIPLVQPEVTIVIAEQKAAADPQRVIHASNAQRLQQGKAVSEVVCSEDSQLRWCVSVDAHVMCMAGAPDWLVVSLHDSSLHCFSKAGRRTTPPLALPAPAIFLASDNKSKVLAVMANGNVKIWNMCTLMVVLECSAQAVIRASTTSISAVALSSNGTPVLTLANMHAYAFHSGLREWMRIADWGFPSSAYHSMIAPHDASELSTHMAKAQARRPSRSALHAAIRQPPQQRQLDSCAHLESCLAAALALECGQDWTNWLVQYVRLLTRQNDQNRLTELCDHLLGPLHWQRCTSAKPGPASHASGSLAGWEPEVLGSDKRAMLKDLVLPILVTNQALSRLALDYQRRLAAVSGSGANRTRPA